MILKTKASRRKLRRWTFEAVVTRSFGVRVGMHSIPSEVRFPLQVVDIGPEKDARATCHRLEADLRDQPQFKDAVAFRVIPVPNETISTEMLQQVQGYKAYNDILQVALEKAATDVARGITPDVIQLTDGQTVNQEHIGKLKAHYYEAAREYLKKQLEDPTQVAGTEPADEDTPDLERLQAAAAEPLVVGGERSNVAVASSDCASEPAVLG